MYDVAIIGGGIIGSFIARELSRYEIKIALIEKDNDVANGTTKANTAIIHGGYNAKLGTNMAKFNVKGNKMFDEICKDLDIEFKRVGSLVLAFNDDDLKSIKELYTRGISNGVLDLKILGSNEILRMEKNINKNIIGGLYAPSCGILSPWELTIALVENAVLNGTKLLLNHRVLDIKKIGDYFNILTNKKDIKSRYIINCGGLFADEINNMVSENKFKIKARRGQYYIFDKSISNIVNTVIFQPPSEMGKGVIVAPTIHGNIIVGPDAENIYDKEGTNTTRESLMYIRNKALKSLPSIKFNKVITSFSGIRAECDRGDFVIEESIDVDGFINVLGIKSPGLTASPAIAEYVVKLLIDIDKKFNKKKNFNPKRKGIIRFQNLSFNEKNEIIRKNPQYGRVICRCEGITEGEIVDSINRIAGATTVDGVKRRIRPGSGRCQGGFCQPRVLEILSRELKKKREDILKDNIGSYILTGRTNKGD